jgi:HlyD family secretion protein
MNFAQSLCLTANILLACLLAGPSSVRAAQKNQPTAPEKKPEAPPAHTVKRGSLKMKVQLDAVFESTEMEPVKIAPKAWADLTVVEAVAHGARVKKGDSLVKFDTEKITEQIEDLERDRPPATTGLELAQAELENLTQSTPQRLDTTKRLARQANDDYTYFEAVGREQREKGTRFNVKNAEQRLDNAREELKQLEKMYKADDLTEETEEIILKRQRFAVDSAEFWLESARLGSDRDLKTLIPREFDTLKSQRRDQELALALAEESLPRTLVRKRYDVEKMKRDQKKSEKRLAELKKDLELLDVRAPIDGVVYYGACESGKWTTGAGIAKRMIPNGKLSPNEVFITIVNPDKLTLKPVVPENELSRVRPGLSGEAAPVSAPDKKLPVKVEEIGFLPLPGGGFEARLSIKREDNLHLMPGMSCKITFEPVKTNVLLAPKEAVFTEGNERVVYLANNDKNHEKHVVKVGESDGQMLEIVEGLSKGDKILLKKPD